MEDPRGFHKSKYYAAVSSMRRLIKRLGHVVSEILPVDWRVGPCSCLRASFSYCSEAKAASHVALARSDGANP